MKRLGVLIALMWLLTAAALGEGWIVDESLEDDISPSQAAQGQRITDPHALTLSFVGDCSIGGIPSARGKEGTYTAVLDEKGYDWPFSLVLPYLGSDDLTFANNEGVFTESDRYQNKNTVLGALPRYAQVYLHSGVDALNTVNNHCLDYYEAGYADTLKTLDDLGIAHFGTLYPDTKREQQQLGLFEIKGVKIGAAGFSYPQTEDLPRIAARIDALRQAGCDLVIVSLHWGRELLTTPKNWQVALARKIIDAGADVIWGHHPHILQQVQFYHGKPILYSTGNFTFGAMQNVDPDTGIFQLRYDLRSDGPHLVRFAVVPCRTQGRGDFRPYVLTDPDEKQKMLKKLIYPRAVEDMQNLPQSFVETGVVVLEDGYIPGTH
ncbi:MAG: CapA family protein [Clostridia bacterium]|nr:CapA family protein [Clostridia bacterium]